MATPQEMSQALLNYISGRAPAPAWLDQLQASPGAARQLFNAVNRSRSDLAAGVGDPTQYLNSVSSTLQGLVQQAYPQGSPVDIAPATDRYIPAPAPGLGENNFYFSSPYGGNALPNYVAPTAPAPTATPLTTDQQSARATLDATLGNYGLGSLGGTLWDQYLHGTPINQILLNMRQTPEYKARFPAMDTLAKRGQAITEQQYVDYERTIQQIRQQAGIPTGFRDSPQDVANLLIGNVSPTEYKDRVDLASQAATTAPPETRDALARFYGIGQGDLTAYFLDPAATEPVLQKRYAAAQIGGAASRAGYGDINAGQAENLAGLGVTEAQAQKGFGVLGQEWQLFNPLDQGENAIGQDEQLAAQFGDNAIAQQAIQQRIARRKAQFGGGGGYATTGAGATGIGTTTTSAS